MAKIKVGLGSNSIQQAIDKLTKLKSEISKLENEIPRELAEMTADKIRTFYGQKGFDSGDSPTIGVEKTDKGYRAYISGEKVIYDEFGTGDIGQANAHPRKDEYPLNAYNSGATIRPTSKLTRSFMREKGLKEGLYWTYRDSGAKIYTQGVPAGLFMYRSGEWLRSNYKKIVKEKVSDMLSKL